MTESEADQLLGKLFPPHPVLDRPTVEELVEWDAEDVMKLSAVWQEAIRSANSDPLRSGHVFPMWQDAKDLLDEPDVDHLTAFGGNRSSKTAFASWLVVQALINNPGTRIMCWSQNEKVSNWQQQSAIYNMLPPEMRKKRKDKVTKVNYSLANGFTDNNFILENGSHCIFYFYTQFMQDPSCIEGYELGWKGGWGEEAPFTNLGNWFDEYLGDPALMETMEARLSTRKAKDLNTFTPIFQYTESVRYLLDGAVTRESRTVSAEDFPPERFPSVAGSVVPYIQEGRRSNSRIIYFHTKENVFNDFDRFKRDLEGKSRAFVLMKAFGVPTKVSASKFPKFSDPVNVIDEIPANGKEEDGQKEHNYTRYHICDPAGDKPWFMIWVAVDEEGQHFVYREWPSFDQWGPWAEWKDGRWAVGEAASGECCGMGYRGYKDLIEAEETEGGDGEIFERIIDPRMGASSTPGMEESTSIIAEMAELGVVFSPAPGLQESEGIQAIQALMDYDTTAPVNQLNKPKLYILRSCGNVIRSMGGYDTAAGKVDLKHPWKDPVDVLRYMAVSALDYVPAENQQRRPLAHAGGY